MKKNVSSYIVSLLCLTFSFLVIFDFVQAKMQLNDLRVLLGESQAQLAQKERDGQELLKQKNKLSDPNYVKEYARGNYLLTQENEQVFILPKQNAE